MDAQTDDADGKQPSEGESAEAAEQDVYGVGDAEKSHDRVEKIHQVVPEHDDAQGDEHGRGHPPISLQPAPVQEGKIPTVEEIVVLQGVKFLLREGIEVVHVKEAVEPDHWLDKEQGRQVQHAGQRPDQKKYAHQADSLLHETQVHLPGPRQKGEAEGEKFILFPCH